MDVALNSAFYVNSVAEAFNRGQAVRHDADGAIRMASDKAVTTVLEAIPALAGAGADEIHCFQIGRAQTGAE